MTGKYPASGMKKLWRMVELVAGTLVLWCGNILFFLLRDWVPTAENGFAVLSEWDYFLRELSLFHWRAYALLLADAGWLVLLLWLCIRALLRKSTRPAKKNPAG